MNIDGNLNIESLQDSYEQNGQNTSVGLGFGSAGPAYLNNVSLAYGATEIFTKTTKEAAGIKELSSYDQNISESENLTALLTSNSINVAKNIINNSDKKDFSYTNADIDLSLALSTSYFTESGRENIAESFENFGENMAKSAQGFSEALAKIPGSPVWVSRWVDDNNNEKKDGFLIDNPAPNLLVGNPFNKDDIPSVGRGDKACKGDFVCRNTLSDESYHLQSLHYGVPGFKSFSKFHDAAMINSDGTERGAAYKFFSIFPYLPINYYGAVGTIIDYKSWVGGNQNKNNN